MIEKRFAISSESNQNIYDTVLKCYYSSIDAMKLCDLLNELNDENKELKEINQDNQDYISSLEDEKNNLQIKLQKIRDYAMEDGEVKQGVVEKVIMND